MSNEKIIGRIEVYEKIKSRFEKVNRKVTITSIGGSGGIGKTYLLNRLLEDTFYDDNTCMILFPETKKHQSFEKFITEGVIHSANHVLPVTKGYFNETSKLIKIMTDIEQKQKKELLKLSQKTPELQAIDDAIIDDIFKIFGMFSDALLQIKALKKFLGMKGLNPKQVEIFANLYKQLKKRKITNPLEGRIPDISGARTIKYNLTNNFNETVAKALLNDISYIIDGIQSYTEEKRFKTIRGKV